MTRCDYDGVFYRVFCVTLLAIAFTFTVILTNVFIDIDGLLSIKGRALPKNYGRSVMQNNHNNLAVTTLPKPDPYDDEDKDYEELDDNYRTKRSLESQNMLLDMENPIMKSILASRLAKLLENVDEKEPTTFIKNDKYKEKSKELETKTGDVELPGEKSVKEPEGNAEAITEDDFLHLTMHNILLHGIKGHMDLNEVYKRIHFLIDNFKPSNRIKGAKSKEIKHLHKLISKKHSSEETSKILDELLNCKELHSQIVKASGQYKGRGSSHKDESHKVAKVFIKTVIDINSIIDDKVNENKEKNYIDNINGLIKLFFNGNSIELNHMDDFIRTSQTSTVQTTTQANIRTTTEEAKPEDVSDSMEKKPARIKKSYLNKIFNNYFKINLKNDSFNSAEIGTSKPKRLKRHVKIRYKKDDNTTDKSKVKKNEKDDELYVEIETNFDSKGLKGEKRKNLIKHLIQKIQKAIHSENTDKSPDKKKKHKHVHVKKRTQSPLDNSKLLSKIVPGRIESIIHRQLNPISKTVASHESVSNIYGYTGESWKKTYTGPRFLTSSKAINSAEMREVNADYAKLSNGYDIPQRIQKPLNTDDGSEEVASANSYKDLGNLKFFIKEIDGSGFSIGFNQYVDEPPDAEAIKLFTGLENILETYHQKYDQAAGPDIEDSATQKTEILNNDYEFAENSQSAHVMARRSIKEPDHHSNEYKIIFDKNYIPYENYQDIYDDRKHKLNSVQDYYRKNIKFGSKDLNAPLVVDDDIFNKNLKPAEILGLANLLDRKKRAINVKKLWKLNKKIKVSRYLNTKAMSTKRIFLNKKRNKRQIDKIRIIASDSPHQHKHSDESIFIVSDENMFADRAIVREVGSPQLIENDADKVEEPHYDIISPYIYEESKEPAYVTNIFDGKSRHNALMSKYPHIFMEEISRSKENNLPDSSLLFSKLVKEATPDSVNTEQNTSAAENNHTQIHVDNLLRAYLPPKTNYKLSVKIMPRNFTDLNTGFKEIHTSINKCYNKNGLMYSSLVNMSEISKVIKLNNTKPKLTTTAPITKTMREKQSKIKMLLNQHKNEIDKQLKHLNQEKDRLETMLANKNETELENNQSSELIDLVMSTDPLKVVQMTKEEMTKLAASALTQTQDKFDANNQITTTPSQDIISTIDYTKNSYNTVSPAISAISKIPELSTTTEIQKRIEKRILNTIQKNDKLTNEILKKIDKNTEILQTFLSKLIDTIPQTKRKTMPSNDLNAPSKINLNEPMSNWKDYHPMHDPFFYNDMSNLEVQKNNSHVSIPFVYAYQQPLHSSDVKSKNPVASIVYHGHIHTNAITNKGDIWKPSDAKTKENIIVRNNNTKRDVNRSRFFIDELDNYKVIPILPPKIPEMLPVPEKIKVTNITAQ